MCISEHKRYVGGSIVGDMVTHVGQFVSKVPDTEGTLGLLDGS
jgi:hypothetical protein